MVRGLSQVCPGLEPGQTTAQPWRCLCRGFSQMTMTRPWRRITLHFSQIFLTLGWTFIGVFPGVVRGAGHDAPGLTLDGCYL